MVLNRKFVLLLLLVLLGSHRVVCQSQDSVFNNPVIYADVPDMDVIRVGNDFYMMSTTMHLMPGAPVMKSKDLVNWEIISYVFDKLTDTPNYDLIDGTVYGRGQWATSLRYHKGKFYVLFSPNDKPYRSYIYTATDPSGKWELLTRTQHFHDSSLFFDDDGRVYVFSGTGSLRELKSDLSDVKPDGVNMKIFERDETETGLLEGSRVIKYEGKYYLLMISMPKQGLRRQVCFRADRITGPYEKKVILEHDFDTYGGVGQGTIVDAKDGKWYGMIFQDRGGIGRVPTLMPCRWIDGWPMLGNEDGQVPLAMEKPVQGCLVTSLVTSDDFEGSALKLNWQWNHNPVNESWTLAERPGFLRLKTSRVVDNLYLAPNTITQRMEGPKCSATIAVDIAEMRDGDVAGFSAFNGDAGNLSVIRNGRKTFLVMSVDEVELDNKNGKKVLGVKTDKKEQVEIDQNMIYLRIDCNFYENGQHKDIATFYYSLDNKKWARIGTEFKMRFDYMKLFMGTRFAIFNYATKTVGGQIDVDYFDYKKF